MRSNVLQRLVALGAATLLSGSVLAQQSGPGGPGGPGGGGPGGRGGPGRNGGPGGDAASIVDRMMSFDANHDGKLAKEEVTDERLQRLFERADADKDGVVTKEELTTLAGQIQAERQQNGAGGPGGGGPGGRGGPGGGGFGGRGGGPGGMPQPGQVLPDRMRGMLNLTAEQRTQLDELQKEVDAKLAKILTDDQKKQLEQLRQRGPRQGGGGGGRGPGGPGGGGPGGGAGGGPGGGPGPQRAENPQGGL